MEWSDKPRGGALDEMSEAGHLIALAAATTSAIVNATGTTDARTVELACDVAARLQAQARVA